MGRTACKEPQSLYKGALFHGRESSYEKLTVAQMAKVFLVFCETLGLTMTTEGVCH
jgi:hypothetical protein